jgi:hypothetical protein
LTSVAILATHLQALNTQLPDLELTIERGPRVRGLDYASSRALCSYATHDSHLARSLDELLDVLRFEHEVLLLATTSPEDLLCALVLAVAARRRHRSLHVTLVDHSYENFSLAPHADRLRATGALESIFDAIVQSKDERDAVVLELLDALWRGERPRGWLRSGSGAPRPAAATPALAPRLRFAPPPVADVAAFAPEPILWTRASPRRCYWSRCAFCVQNVSFDDPRSPSLTEVPTAALRLEALHAAGYRHVYLSDEALSPPFLRALAASLQGLAAGLRWACRCKLETGYDAALGRALRAAGCYELLFGIESVSPRLLRRTDKWLEGVDAAHTRAILHGLDAAGLGTHVNLIAGFPGATLAETVADVDWAIATMRPMQSATYTLNAFVLYPGSPMCDEPSRFGIVPVPDAGDMPASHVCRLDRASVADGLEIAQHLPALAARLEASLGWDEIGALPGGRDALALIHGAGHGCAFKAREDNPFARPRA